MTKNEDLITRARMDIGLLEQEVQTFKADIEKLELQRVLERIVVLETHVAELKRTKDETEKRQWQWVYLVIGGIITLAVSVIVQLLILTIKK